MDRQHRHRSGRTVRQSGSFSAYVPSPLPPDPPLELNPRLISLLSRADRAIGRLDGTAHIIPDHRLFIAMYVRKEAVESSRIEGTQSTLDDVLTYELDSSMRMPSDIVGVVNYVQAMDDGIDRLQTLPLSLRLIREIHGVLLTDVRGGTKAPGAFRTTQNWIGPAGAPLGRASFVPPTVPDMKEALNALERYMHEGESSSSYPPLIQAALIHAQFETIHPFLDGNGRVGRLLITLYLIHERAVELPLLYLSAYIKRHRSEYYARLMSIREDGDWEGWVAFFLQGVAETAEDAVRTASSIDDLRRECQNALRTRGSSASSHAALDIAFAHPMLNVKLISEKTGVHATTATRIIAEFVDLGILREITGQQRNRIFRFDRYINLFETDDTEAADQEHLTTIGDDASA